MNTNIKGLEISKESIVLPRKLTAENGAKSLLIGEFFETIEVHNQSYCGCGECDFCINFPDEPKFLKQEVPIQWTTIKEIYDKVVDFFDV